MFGSDSTPELTEEQTDEILAQRREISRYIHEDKKRASYDGKFYLLAMLLFIMLFSLVVLRYKPEVFSEVLSLVLGALGGGIGGYGIGKSRQ